MPYAIVRLAGPSDFSGLRKKMIKQSRDAQAASGYIYLQNGEAAIQE